MGPGGLKPVPAFKPFMVQRQKRDGALLSARGPLFLCERPPRDSLGVTACCLCVPGYVHITPSYVVFEC